VTARARRVVAELAVLGIDVTSVANVEQFLALIDQGDTDDELVRAIVDWLADLYAEADARRMAEVPIEKARRESA
jgi:arginine decarboxylase-like protein